MTTIEIRNDLQALRQQAAPLYHKYPRQHQPQGAYIELDCQTGAVAADWNGEIGNAIPFSVYHGHDRRYAVPCEITGKALAELLEDAEFLALLQRVVNGYDPRWDGHNMVAELDEDAEAADEEIINCLEANLTEHDLAEVWGVDEWLFTNCTLREHWADQPIAEAVAELQAAVEPNQALDGDIEEALIREAKEIFTGAHPEKLTRTQVDELRRRDEITEGEQADWLAEHGN